MLIFNGLTYWCAYMAKGSNEFSIEAILPMKTSHLMDIPWGRPFDETFHLILFNI